MRSSSRKIAGCAGFGLACLLGALMLVPALLGLHRYVITGASMTGSYDRGSIVYEREVPVARLRVGDVITYVPPGESRRVTHRIVWAGRSGGRTRAFRTKGDANATPDPWRFTLSARTQPRVAFALPLAGYLLAALGIRWVRIVVIGLPALLVALVALAGIRRREELPA
jgi:signal peptidase